jgi:hypothetical protein
MRRCLVIVALPLIALLAGGGGRGAAPPPAGGEAGPRAGAGDPLAPGNNLPGTFNPYNVNAALPPETVPVEPTEKKKSKEAPYSTKHKFHCLISEYDLDPTVMLISRSADDSAALRALLTGLDAAIERNRRVTRLRAFAVFLYDDLADLVAQDDKREERARALERLAEDLKLRHVVLAVAGKSDLAKYRLGDDDALTAVLYKKLRIVSSYRVPRDKLDAADAPVVKAVLADVAKKLGAAR